MTSTSASPIEDKPRRRTYRHGDLRQALIAAGLELARQRGPDAVVLREVTRRVGVVPNAAYRHFASRDDLLDAVRSAALSQLARSMEAEIETIPPALAPADRARQMLRAVGRSYLRFAEQEPGLFRTAFVPIEVVEGVTDPAKAGKSGLNPFQLLGAALDAMVDAGVLPAERRPGAEYLAWSTVHGLAMLRLQGPLGRVPTEQWQQMQAHALDMVERGL